MLEGDTDFKEQPQENKSTCLQVIIVPLLRFNSSNFHNSSNFYVNQTQK